MHYLAAAFIQSDLQLIRLILYGEDMILTLIKWLFIKWQWRYVFILQGSHFPNVPWKFPLGTNEYAFQKARKVQMNGILLARGTIFCSRPIPKFLHFSARFVQVYISMHDTYRPLHWSVTPVPPEPTACGTGLCGCRFLFLARYYDNLRPRSLSRTVFVWDR